jgi:hypothetical protein
MIGLLWFISQLKRRKIEPNLKKSSKNLKNPNKKYLIIFLPKKWNLKFTINLKKVSKKIQKIHKK